MSGVSEIRLRVRYAETDQMGVVYHANYLVWMEMGRVELCRTMGVRYRDLEEQEGVLLTVVEATCRYHAPARYDDEVIVRNECEALDVTSDRVRIPDDVLGNRRQTRDRLDYACLLQSRLRPCRLPGKYWSAFGVREGLVVPRLATCAAIPSRTRCPAGYMRSGPHPSGCRPYSSRTPTSPGPRR